MYKVLSTFECKDGLDKGKMKIKLSTPQGRPRSIAEHHRRNARSPKNQAEEAWTRRHEENKLKHAAQHALERSSVYQKGSPENRLY